MSKPLRLFYRGFEEHDHIDTEDRSDSTGYNILEAFTSKLCPNCGNGFEAYTYRIPNSIKTFLETNPSKEIFGDTNHTIFHCQSCGWWQLKKIFKLDNIYSNWAYQYHGVLENIDISDNQIAINDLRQHLSINWNDRKFISAGKAEDLVCSILKEHFSCDVYHSSANVNSPDGGIDLFVCSSNDRIRAAVQVKRRLTDKKESVSEVRNFVGALILEGYKKGIFVTTAEDFTKPAKKIKINPHLRKHKLELDLINGSELLELLHAQVPPEKYELPLGLTLSTKWKDENGKTIELNKIFNR